MPTTRADVVAWTYVGGHALHVIAYTASIMPGWDRDKVACGARLYGIPSPSAADVVRRHLTFASGVSMSFVPSMLPRGQLVCVCIVLNRPRVRSRLRWPLLL